MLTEQHMTWRGSGSGALLDIHGHSEAALARALVRIAAAEVSDLAGSPVEGTVTLVRPDGTPCTVAPAEGTGVELSRWDQRTGTGPTARALGGRLSVVLNHRCPDPRWPEYVGNLTAAGFRSAVAVPLRLERGYSAALTFYSATANMFAPDLGCKVLVFSGVAAKSLRLALKHRADLAVSAEHRASLASRTAIDTACGVIMGQNQCSYETALQILTQVSKQRNLKVREVAEDLLRAMPGGVPAAYFKARG
ncbi:GAF and ANTAR domain-containing protein [Pseudarthrobacter sulfonivorans]|uniref:GAF and ANTAR domain-containing protein n=1 Tax=Pseudarthrobacter sulfonivorans TaxID=121292 RepID=UPI00286BC103|nr:GAF and ANTAR domain-containing protein [Pseudarthrobacter sulfonivorans]